jgi:hypothetical protein
MGRPEPQDEGEPEPAGGVERCEQQVKAAKDFVAANKACKQDSDCMQVNAGCFGEQEDCCVVYLDKKHDGAKWKTILDAIETCQQGPNGGPCGCCAGLPHPAKCREGKCG